MFVTTTQIPESGEKIESPASQIRVLLITKYKLVQESLELLIESNRDLAVIGAFSFGEDGEQWDGTPPADVAVVYLSDGDRLEVIADLLAKMPELRVILIVAGADLDSQAAALKLGAVGIVHKEQSPKLLIEAIRQTHAGETWLNQVLLYKLLERGKTNGKRSPKPADDQGAEALTARELEVVKMIGEGLKNKKIAERLQISEATVRHHLSSIYGKVGVEDRLNLVILAYRNGLIPTPNSVVDTA
jgi:DNA-binding NarL/FixJ family response regulator